MSPEKYGCKCGETFSTVAELSHHFAQHLEDSGHVIIETVESNRLYPFARPDFLARLREVNLPRCVRYGHGDPSEWLELTGEESLGQWGAMAFGCAIAGEVGELCNLLKKFERQLRTDPTPAQLRLAIESEIADVIIYLDLLGSMFHVDLRAAIARKFNADSEKHGHPERIEP